MNPSRKTYLTRVDMQPLSGTDTGTWHFIESLSEIAHIMEYVSLENSTEGGCAVGTGWWKTFAPMHHLSDLSHTPA